MQGEAKVNPFVGMPTIKGATWHKNQQFFFKKSHDTHWVPTRYDKKK
jgi:hypothetical protein